MTPRISGEALDADGAALSAAGAAAEEALSLHRQALAVLEEGWQSESGTAATDLIRRQCAQAADLVEALHGAAAELRSLRDTVDPLGANEVSSAEPVAARLDDRAAPRFQTPPVIPAAPASSSFPPWPSGTGAVPLSQLPNIGGTLAGLVTQIADALSPDATDAGAAVAAEGSAPPNEERPSVAVKSAAEITAAGSEELASPVMDPPERMPVEAAPPPLSAPPESVLAQPEPPPLPPEPLAAERQPEPPEPLTEARTPCEIAADELPQVGE